MRDIIIIVAALFMILSFTIVTSQQVSKYSEAMKQLKSLKSDQVESIHVYDSDFPIKLRFEVFEKSDIDQFLNAMALAEKYSVGKRTTPHIYNVAIVIKPQEIHLRISDSEKDPSMVNGGIGEFKSTDHYSHYGNFQVSGLKSWVKKNVLQNDN